ALLLTATTPPTGRKVLVNGFEAWVEANGRSTALTTQRYAPGVLHPDGASRIALFEAEPWPAWRYDVGDNAALTHEVFAVHGTGTVVVAWTLINGGPVDLHVRPLLSGRDYHSTHHENGAFRFDASIAGASISFRPYDGVPSVTMLTNGVYEAAPQWYRNFLYSVEQERGLDAVEDLASPGVLTWRLSAPADPPIWILK